MNLGLTHIFANIAKKSGENVQDFSESAVKAAVNAPHSTLPAQATHSAKIKNVRFDPKVVAYGTTHKKKAWPLKAPDESSAHLDLRMKYISLISLSEDKYTKYTSLVKNNNAKLTKLDNILYNRSSREEALDRGVSPQDIGGMKLTLSSIKHSKRSKRVIGLREKETEIFKMMEKAEKEIQDIEIKSGNSTWYIKNIQLNNKKKELTSRLDSYKSKIKFIEKEIIELIDDKIITEKSKEERLLMMVKLLNKNQNPS